MAKIRYKMGNAPGAQWSCVLLSTEERDFFFSILRNEKIFDKIMLYTQDSGTRQSCDSTVTGSNHHRDPWRKFECVVPVTRIFTINRIQILDWLSRHSTRVFARDIVLFEDGFASSGGRIRQVRKEKRKYPALVYLPSITANGGYRNIFWNLGTTCIMILNLLYS